MAWIITHSINYLALFHPFQDAQSALQCTFITLADLFHSKVFLSLLRGIHDASSHFTGARTSSLWQDRSLSFSPGTHFTPGCGERSVVKHLFQGCKEHLLPHCDQECRNNEKKSHIPTINIPALTRIRTLWKGTRSILGIAIEGNGLQIHSL